ncbi:MAG: SdrD B-like domain-containing protein [Patescibacteria group bacterium]
MVQVGSENNSFILKNKIDAPVTIIAHKIVCNDESHLPNWGAVKSHGNPITADTAQNFVDNSQGNCWFEEDWGFEWGPADSGYSGDDLIGSAGGKWNAFGPTNENGKTQVEINNLSSLGNRIEMREVLKEGYVPFTYATSGNNNSNNVSAEFYCHRDVMNYDNWEWINSPQYGQAYHCVAFNAPLHGSAEIYKFDDENANGTQDEGENFLSDWEIVLGEKTETTDNDGKVIFADLNPGQYDLSEILKEGWGQTNIYCLGDQEEPDNNNIEPTPSPPLEATGVLGLANTVFAQAQENNSHQITVNPGQTTTCYIGNFDLGQISGYKIYDRNDNGTKEEGEEGIEDWEICLTGDNLETQNCTKTDSNGYYEFTGLTAGTYTVTEEDRSAEGWRASNPESGTYENIEIASGSNVEADFYNAPPANIWLTKNNNTTGSVGVGQTIEYTLTITVGQRTLSEMKLRDVLPDGFVYQTGTSTIDGATVEPTTNEGKTLIWNWDEEVPGESVVVVKYTIQIEPTNKPATYTNIAHVYGYGSPTLVESSIVDSSVKIDPEYQVEGRTVGGQVLGAATEGKVLGATTLPATGANTWYSIVALILIAGGITLRVKTKKFEDN